MGIIIISTVDVGGDGLSREAVTYPFTFSKRQKIRTFASLFIVLSLLVLAYSISGNESIGSNGAISLLIGAALGITFERGRFCFFCIFRDTLEDRNTTPFLGILAAIAVGAIGYAVTFSQFLPDASTDRLPPNAHIGPVSWVLVIAGFTFGIGMALSGACLSGHLYRLGQGSIRAIPALLGSLVGFGISFKIWNSLYLNIISDSPTWWLPHTFGYGGSLVITLIVLSLIGFFAIRFGTSSEPLNQSVQTTSVSQSLQRSIFLNRWNPLATGAIVGVIGTIAYLRIEPLGVTRQLSTTSRTYLDQLNFLPEKVEGLDTLAGCIAVVSKAITNNGWLILGFVLASFAAALIGNRFKFENISIRNGSSAFLGGILLGLSSMIALGCTVGVLLSGTQSFALSGWVFFISVFFGTFVAIKLRLHRL